MTSIRRGDMLARNSHVECAVIHRLWELAQTLGQALDDRDMMAFKGRAEELILFRDAYYHLKETAERHNA
jgi:hypothetical protein